MGVADISARRSSGSLVPNESHAVRPFDVADAATANVVDDTNRLWLGTAQAGGFQFLTDLVQQIPGVARIGVLPSFPSPEKACALRCVSAIGRANRGQMGDFEVLVRPRPAWRAV